MQFLDAVKNAGLTGSNGLQALKAIDRQSVDARQNNLSGSVDLDEAFSKSEAQSNRWDYGIGYEVGAEDFAIWIEPHSATSVKEVATMLRKLQWMKDKLATEPFSDLQRMTQKARKSGARTFWWTTQGKIGFNRNTPEAKRLANAGLNFPCKRCHVGET